MGKWLDSLEEPGVPAVADDSELEQWRKTVVWHKDSPGRTWSLRIVRTRMRLAYVMPDGGEWLMSRDSQRYSSSDAAMRAAEAPFGLPKCRVEGES